MCEDAFLSKKIRVRSRVSLGSFRVTRLKIMFALRNSINTQIETSGFAKIPSLLGRKYCEQLAVEVDTALDRPADEIFDKENMRNQGRTASSILELDWMPLLKRIFNKKIIAAHEKSLGADFLISLPHSRIRRQWSETNQPDTHMMHPWHSDAGVGYHPGLATTLWIALSLCGESKPDNGPSLEFMAEPNPPMLPGEHSDSAFVRIFGDKPRLAIKARPGDAVLFPTSTFHRTHRTPEMCRDRLSIDIRCAAKSHPPSMMAEHPMVSLEEVLCG